MPHTCDAQPTFKTAHALAAYRLSSPLERPPLRRRASGLGLALGVNLLLVLALLTLGVRIAPREPSGAIVVDLLPRSDESPERARPAPAQKPLEPAQPALAAVVPPPRVVLPPLPAPADRPLEMIVMSPEDYAAADIAKLPKAADSGSSVGDSEEVGRGPHGEILYAAEWARHPTNAELGGYLPRNASDGYGLIACKTAPGNRVEDCVELEQEPRGSHLASAVRQAAWQFRVRPPRKNGRAMVGEWVRIRIDYISTRDE